MADINRSLLINYRHIFGFRNSKYSRDIASLDRVTWFKILARFNFLLRKGSKPSVIDVLNLWFRADNNVYANELLQKIRTAYHEEIVKKKTLTTLNVWTNLTLLDDILKQVSTSQHFDPLETERRLFDAYLTVNEVYGIKSDRITKEIQKESGQSSALLDWFAKVTTTILIPYNDIANPNVIELWITQFIKSCYCLLYFEADHPILLKQFLDKYGIRDWREYLKGIMPLIDHAVFHNPEGINAITIKDALDKAKSKRFLDALSLASDAIYEVQTDFIHARANPVFKIDEDTYMVIDQVLVINKMYNSIFFEMLEIVRQTKVSAKPYKNFFQLFTSEFIEHFISYKLFDYIYDNNTCTNLSGRMIKEIFKVDTEPDYYVRCERQSIVFEIKGSIITGDSKQSFKYGDIELQLKEKFYLENGNKPKAVIQLIERIETLLLGKAVYDPGFDPNNFEVFPVLIVSELAMITPGINHILNKWFRSEIDKNLTLKGIKTGIHNLSVIDLNSLILYSDQFKADSRILPNLIIGYEKQTELSRIHPRPATINSEKKLEDTIMKMLVPFPYYLRANLKVQTPALFMKFAKEIFNE
jgi:hypothetical protein